MTFGGCNSQIVFATFFAVYAKSILAQLLPKHMGTGYLVNATPPTVLSVFNFAG